MIHVLGGLLYSICGLTQFVAGIYFMLELPIFQLGSNIWTGAWVRFGYSCGHYFIYNLPSTSGVNRELALPLAFMNALRGLLRVPFAIGLFG